MRIKIDHATHYAYATPQKRIVQSYRLTPTICDNQRICDWSVTVDGAVLTPPFTDGAGDQIITMSMAGPVDGLRVHVQGVVDTTDQAGVLRGQREMINPLAYLRPTPATRPSGGMIETTQEIATRTPEGNPLALAHALAEHVSDHITYAPGTTQAGDTAAAAWQAGQGVCQDHAQALIALARAVNLPARYVIGYLFADSDGIAHEASHAWAELYISGLGWVGFDPANATCPNERYIRLGSGLDAANAAPIRGVAFGSGTEIMDINVSVTAEQ